MSLNVSEIQYSWAAAFFWGWSPMTDRPRGETYHSEFCRCWYELTYLGQEFTGRRHPWFWKVSTRCCFNGDWFLITLSQRSQWCVLFSAVVVEVSVYSRSSIMVVGMEIIRAPHLRVHTLASSICSQGNMDKELRLCKIWRKAHMVSRFWDDVASTSYHKANSHVHWFFCYMKSHSIELSCTRPRVSTLPLFPAAAPAVHNFALVKWRILWRLDFSPHPRFNAATLIGKHQDSLYFGQCHLMPSSCEVGAILLWSQPWFTYWNEMKWNWF